MDMDMDMGVPGWLLRMVVGCLSERELVVTINNKKKSKVTLFNTSYQNYFSPELKSFGVALEVVKEMKLLGGIIPSHLKWHQNTKNITKKGSGYRTD